MTSVSISVICSTVKSGPAVKCINISLNMSQQIWLNYLQNSNEICYSLDGLRDDGSFSLNLLPSGTRSFKDHIK